jgi:hypothetical protein
MRTHCYFGRRSIPLPWAADLGCLGQSTQAQRATAYAFNGSIDMEKKIEADAAASQRQIQAGEEMDAAASSHQSDGVFAGAQQRQSIAGFGAVGIADLHL